MNILKSDWYNYQLSSLSFENVFVIYECDLCRKSRTNCCYLRIGYVFHSHDPDFPSICFRSLAQWGPPHSATCCCGGVTGIQEVYAFLTRIELITKCTYRRQAKFSFFFVQRVALLDAIRGVFRKIVKAGGASHTPRHKKKYKNWSHPAPNNQ